MEMFDPTYLEILRMARELVINEYTDRRADQHNKWLVESEHLWRNQRLRVAYPTIPPYPTETVILERAQILLEFVKSKELAVVAQDKSTPRNALVVLSEEPSGRILPDVLSKMEQMRRNHST